MVESAELTINEQLDLDYLNDIRCQFELTVLRNPNNFNEYLVKWGPGKTRIVSRNVYNAFINQNNNQ